MELYRTNYDDVDPLDYYDMIINVNTISRMKKIDDSDNYGWDVRTSKKGMKNYKRLQDNEEKEIYPTVVGIIGNKNTGKSFILSKLSGFKLPMGPNVSTTSISAKFPTNERGEIIYLDSCGLNSPILSPQIKREKGKLIHEEELSEMSADEKLTKKFLLSFMLECSDVLLISIGKLTYSEQKMLIQIKKSNLKFNKILIIHNLCDFKKIKEVEHYIDNVLRKSLIFEVEEHHTTFLEAKRKVNTTFFVEVIEEEEENQRKGEIIHLIMGLEGTEAGNYFNEATLYYIKQTIGAITKRKPFDIIEELRRFYSDKSNEYIEEPIPKKEIKYNELKKKIYVESYNQIVLEKTYVDYLGNKAIIGQPLASKYEFWLGGYWLDDDNILTVQIEIPGDNRIGVKKLEWEEYYNFIVVEGKKKLPNFISLDQINKQPSAFSNIKQGKFRFTLRLPVSTFGLLDWKNEGVEWNKVNRKNKQIQAGVLTLTFFKQKSEEKEIFLGN